MTWNEEAALRSGERIRFSFGRNWQKYLARLTPEREAWSRASLEAAFGNAGLQAETFLDIGSGSGIFSLAAHTLGAARVASVDIDPFSVACAEHLRERAGSPATWTVCSGSMLERSFVETLAPATRVYCWGVLHHTGAMWSALDLLLTRVAPGGVLVLALYTRPTLLPVHMALKRAYNRLPVGARGLMSAPYAAAILAKRVIIDRESPVGFMRRYGQTARGMSLLRDVDDWLGGLPFEHASSEEVSSNLAKRPNFRIEQVTARGGLNEYLIRDTRTAQRAE